MKDIIAIVTSQEGGQIRLTYKQWSHITENHDYMAGCLDLVLETLDDPDLIIQGWTDEKIALKNYGKTIISQKSAIVAYEELAEDGFVITAFLTSSPEKIIIHRDYMAKTEILKSLPYLLTAPSDQIWTNYDQEADVMYISFRKPQNANDSILEDNLIYHYHDQDLVGITVLNASHFSTQH